MEPIDFKLKNGTNWFQVEKRNQLISSCRKKRNQLISNWRNGTNWFQIEEMEPIDFKLKKPNQ